MTLEYKNQKKLFNLNNMKLYKSKKLLNVDNNPKTIKGQKYKFMTAILYLAPAKISGFVID
jgi:hypothetical protein